MKKNNIEILLLLVLCLVGCAGRESDEGDEPEEEVVQNFADAEYLTNEIIVRDGKVYAQAKEAYKQPGGNYRTTGPFKKVSAKEYLFIPEGEEIRIYGGRIEIRLIKKGKFWFYQGKKDSRLSPIDGRQLDRHLKNN